MPISEVADFLTGALTVNEVTYPVPPSPSSIFLADSTPASGHGAEEVMGGGEGRGGKGGYSFFARLESFDH